MTADPRLICPLDLPDRASTEAMVERIGDAISFYKIGLELLATDGMALARELKADGRQVFTDWKLHDIGETVRRATAAITATGACDFLTVHAEPQVLAAAVKGRDGDRQVKILGVTVLTSLTEDDLADLSYGLKLDALVERRVRQTLDAGADGVVASPHEAAQARRISAEAGRPDFLVVTPGVRPSWAAKNDQARAATPAQALAAGASHLVSGRPITHAADPRAAANAIVAEMAERAAA
ncbi:orotidine-5'-phosphate decarboxylase [Caulobacter sp. S45]|uniref:orotidine-5'-phosphate decarboxylase n=1 Tax=Caulobacter sp. S45 TaxID=1641861 RepID=UPI001575A72A|nr:orotidine-5'-phosphate decarboxylase [Caulobacter sp. S45]